MENKEQHCKHEKQKRAIVVIIQKYDANLVIMQPTIKIEIWSRKVEIGLIGVWHNGNLPQGTNTIGMK